MRFFIHNAYEAARDSLYNLRELDALIREHRVIADKDLVRRALEESAKYAANRSVKNHLQAYADSLREQWILLPMDRVDDNRISFLTDIVARCVDSSSLDIMRLSTELVERDAMQLCGDCTAQNRKTAWYEKFSKSVRPNSPSDPSVIFNPDMMTNIQGGMPSIVFATGVNSPIINAWPMKPSFENQSPINIQMPMPGDIENNDPISLELHFLVRREAPSTRGIARIEVKSVYLDHNEQFNIFESPQTFQFSNSSNNFSVSEPTNSDSVRHIRVIIPLENVNAKRGAFALFSMTRMEPNGSSNEYEGNLYLAAAAFKYTSND